MNITVQERVYDGVESRIQIRSDISSEMLVGGLSVFTINSNIILSILDKC